MQAKREFRDRADEQVAVLDALVDRHEEGLTVLELRSSVDVDIDRIEAALGELQSAGLIRVEEQGGATRIHPDEKVVPTGEDDEAPSLVDALREKLPF
jgi:DNA-binding transcriptional ArsR family regulator